MGMYIYISEQDRATKRVVEDPEVNEALQEALLYSPSLMIEQSARVAKRWGFRPKTVQLFQVYHEAPAHDGTAYQARYQMSGSGGKEIVIAYLHGVINTGMEISRSLEEK